MVERHLLQRARRSLSADLSSHLHLHRPKPFQRFAARPSATSLLSAGTAISRPALFHSSAARLALSADARKKIDEAVRANPLVVFMKGTPELPMCGFSRAVCQIMEVQGVKPESMK